MMPLHLKYLLVGKGAPLGARGASSGIAKSSVQSVLTLTELGFCGDEQGDRVRHGGPEKAVHHYPFDRYAAWAKEIGDRETLIYPGAFGENLSTKGLTEHNVAVGDVFELGTATIEISQGRQPCWKLNKSFGRSDMAKSVQSGSRTGRVHTGGEVGPGDRLMLIARKIAGLDFRPHLARISCRYAQSARAGDARRRLANARRPQAANKFGRGLDAPAIRTALKST